MRLYGRRVQCVGRSTLMVTIPKEIAASKGIHVGDLVEIELRKINRIDQP